MSLLKQHQKKEIRFDKGGLTVYELSEIHKEQLFEMLEKQNINITEGGYESDNVDTSIVRYILREATSIQNEVDEYNDEELEILFENADRELQLFVREIESVINEVVEDYAYLAYKNMELITKMINIINSNISANEIEAKFNRLAKKNKMDMTLKDFIVNKDNPDGIKKVIEKSKKQFNKNNKR